MDLAGVSPQKTQAFDTHSPEGKKKSKGIMKFFGRSFSVCNNHLILIYTIIMPKSNLHIVLTVFLTLNKYKGQLTGIDFIKCIVVTVKWRQSNVIP